jgi:hypothetical protein
MVSAQLARREAELGGLFERLGSAAAAITAGARAGGVATATADDPARFTLDSVRYVLDPETPDVRGDDTEVAAPAPARLRVAAGLRDAFTLELEGLPLPFNALARAALGAWLARQGASSSAEYVSVAVCPVVGPVVRGATGACGDACVAAACRRAITAVATTFDDALATLDPPRVLLDLRGSAGSTAAAGTLSVEQLAGMAGGGFRGDPATAVTAAALLTRFPAP